MAASILAGRIPIQNSCRRNDRDLAIAHIRPPRRRDVVTISEFKATPHIADAPAGICHLFVHDLVLPCRIGVHQHEREADQPVRINVDLAVRESGGLTNDKLANVVCYEDLIDGIRSVVGGDHVNLVETLAENIAALCLKKERVVGARIRIEKINIFPEAGGVGIEIERTRE